MSPSTGLNVPSTERIASSWSICSEKMTASGASIRCRWRIANVRKLPYLGVPLALSVVGLYLWGGSPFYIGEPIEGWVVDADTRMPLDGVVVVATWFKETVLS